MTAGRNLWGLITTAENSPLCSPPLCSPPLYIILDDAREHLALVARGSQRFERFW